jgi:hypothetical protein
VTIGTTQAPMSPDSRHSDRARPGQRVQELETELAESKNGMPAMLNVNGVIVLQIAAAIIATQDATARSGYTPEVAPRTATSLLWHTFSKSMPQGKRILPSPLIFRRVIRLASRPTCRGG